MEPVARQHIVMGNMGHRKAVYLLTARNRRVRKERGREGKGEREKEGEKQKEGGREGRKARIVPLTLPSKRAGCVVIITDDAIHGLTCFFLFCLLPLFVHLS